MSRKSKSPSPVVANYMKQVAMNAYQQGKPTSNENIVAVYAERIAASVKAVVPVNYRLPVRMAFRRVATQLTSGI